MTISNSNLLKPFITGTELPPFKEDVFLKQKNNLKKPPWQIVFSNSGMKLSKHFSGKIDEIKNSKDFFQTL